MEGVWQELFKKDRQSKAFFYPALTPAMRADQYRRDAAELRSMGGARNDSEAKVLEDLAASYEKQDDEGEDDYKEDNEEDDDNPGESEWYAQELAARLLLRKALLEALISNQSFSRSLKTGFQH
jgi:hypothetical protein